MTLPWPQPASRAGRAGIRAAAKPPYPAGDELVEPDGLAADHIEHIARDPAGGCGDDGGEVGLLDQLVDVDALDDGIHVHPVDHGFHIHPCEHAVQVDPVQQRVQTPVQQRVQIQRGNRKLDRPLRDGLRQRLHARDEPAPHRAPSSKRIHVHGVSWCGR